MMIQKPKKVLAGYTGRLMDGFVYECKKQKNESVKWSMERAQRGAQKDLCAIQTVL